jgi:DNA-binding PadR family transcriptional regulator
MEQAIYLILDRINNADDYPVTWYQLDRMFRARGLHDQLDQLIPILNSLEKDGLIVKKANDDKPEILYLTESGTRELARLSALYEGE